MSVDDLLARIDVQVTACVGPDWPDLAGLLARIGVEVRACLGVPVLPAQGSASGGLSFAGSARGQRPGAVAKPTASTTGVPAGTTLTAWTGGTDVTQDGLVIDGKDVASATGTLRVTGSNVTIRNSRFKHLIFYGPGPILVEDCEMVGGHFAADAYYRAISGVTVRRIYTHDLASDGMDLFSSSANRLTDVSVSDSLFTGFDFSDSPTSHGDGLQVRGITGLTISGCVFDMGPWQVIPYNGTDYHPKNAAVYLEGANGGNFDVQISDVWLNGGGYTFYANISDTTSSLSRARVGRDYGYGPASLSGTGTWQFDGNVWDDTGAPVPQLS